LSEWRTSHDEGLRDPSGWLSIIGRDWLEEGANAVGSTTDARIRLPPGKAPANVGTLFLVHGKLSFRVTPGVGVSVDGAPAANAVELRSDANGAVPSSVAVGMVSFYVVDRDGRMAAIVKDSTSAALETFAGIETYPPDPSWRVSARFEPYPAGRTIEVPTVRGTVQTLKTPGAMVFERGGTTYRLDAVQFDGDPGLLIIFADQTNKHGTYGGGRFLDAQLPAAEGTVWLDFNRAYSPPCARCPFAICPLPPQQNTLSVAVEAGEKAPAAH